jgi:geranylgeranyl reductase family protein
LYDVIVIGAGPVGSRVAHRLAGRGHRVMVLERRPQVGEKVCCTGIVSEECARAFDLDEGVILRRANSAKLFSPSGKLLQLRREESQACILDRAAFDLAMVSRAQGEGAEYVFDSPVSDIAVGEKGVRVEVSRQERRHFEARAVVIAAGFGSRLVQKLGLGELTDFALGAQAEVETPGIEEVEVHFGQKIAPGFFGWLVPTRPGRARVGLLSRHNPERYLRDWLESLQAQGKVVSAESKLSCGAVPLKPLDRTHGERVVVVGDAAGQVKPTTGGGIYYGLLCADIAADTLHQALEQDDLSMKSLARYEREWRERLEWELKIGRWARKLFERLDDHRLDQLFDILKANHIDEALLEARDISFDWHSQAILMLLGRAVVAKVMGIIRIPF